MIASLFCVTSAGDLDGLGLVLAHEGDGLEPALEEGAHRVGLLRDDLVGREDDVDVEVLDVAEADDDARLRRSAEVERVAEVHDDAVDVAALERRDLARHRAHRLDLDAVRAPALPVRGLADQPVGQRARGRDADLLALEIGRGLRPVGPRDDRHQQRRAGHGGDRLDRRALGDEGHAPVPSRAAMSIEPAAAACCMRASPANAIDSTSRPFLAKIPVLDADLDRRERERFGDRLADAELLGCACADASAAASRRARERCAMDGGHDVLRRPTSSAETARRSACVMSGSCGSVFMSTNERPAPPAPSA